MDRKRKRIISCLLLPLFAAVFLLPFSQIWAEEAEKDPLDDYSAIVYDIRSGFPFTEALAVAQTPDGFIYVGCYGGLLRYDGRDFSRFEDILGVKALTSGAEGRLWAATTDGLYVFEKEEFRRYGTEEGLPSESVNDVSAGSGGILWAATDKGLAFVRPDGSVGTIEDSRVSNTGIESVCAADGDTAYCCTSEGDVFAVKDGQVSAFRYASEFAEDISYAYPDNDRPGYVYLSTVGSSVYHGDISGPVSGMERIVIPQLSYFNVMTEKDGVLWVCADNGIARIDSRGVVSVPEGLPVNSTIYDVMCDREGNIWFASTHQGIMKLAPNIFTDISRLSDMGKRVVNSTWLKDGLLYVGTDSGLVVLDGEYRTVKDPVSDLLSSERVRAVKEDSSGDLWFCCFGENALVRLSQDGEISVLNKDNGLVTNYVRTIFERADGSLVVSESGAVHFIKDGALSLTIDASRGFTSSGVLSIGESDDGTLYLGTNGDGVYVVKDGYAEPFSGRSDISSGVILQLKNDPSRDIVWVLTSNSVAAISDGQIKTADSFPKAHIYDMLFAPDGGLWLLGANGFYYIGAEDVLSEETAGYSFFSASTGLMHMVTANSRNYVSPEGDAYIACTDGLLGLNVSRSTNDSARLSFTVPYIEADGARLMPGDDMTFTVPGSAKKITVYCYALSYALGDSEISYCLEGFDPEYETVKRSALGPVSYTNLPGGLYRFVMTGPDGENGGEKSYSVIINKEKLLTEKTGFRIAILAAIVAAGAAAAFLLLRRQAVKAAKEREKERISKELNMASELQLSMLPGRSSVLTDRPEFDLFASMDPAKEVGGDFYDYFLIGDDHLILITADVSGKGVPAALFMMISKTLLKNTALTGISPAAVLNEVNTQLCDGNNNNMFVTVWLGVLELSTGKLVWADAGHEKPVLFHDGAWDFLKKHQGVALGLIEPELLELDDDPPFVDQELILSPGDVLFQYTDGVPEATDAKEQLFGDERLLEALNGSATQDPEELLAALRKQIDGFVKDMPQFDDITMLALRFNGALSEGEGAAL